MTDGHVRLRGIRKALGGPPVLRECDLDVLKGEVMTLLGPSGCGKTTLLRTIAGFVVPDAGSVSIGGSDVTLYPPNRRSVGMVFHHYALFPHMTVFGNVAYGLACGRPSTRSSSPAGPIAGPPSCPAASSNGFHWRASSSWSRRSCSWTSRSGRWMPSCARPCRLTSGGWFDGSGSRPCS